MCIRDSHPLAVLASRMPWQEIEARVAQVFSRKGCAGVAMPDLGPFGEQVQRAAAVINVAVELKLIQPQELARVIVDSTVQHKAIAHPTTAACRRRRGPCWWRLPKTPGSI